jgi:hypothetical protein
MKTTNYISTVLVGVIGLAMVIGCSALRGGKVTREQLHSDIKVQNLTSPNGDWRFKEAQAICFTVLDKDVNYTDTEAVIPMEIASWKSMSIGPVPVFAWITGTMTMKYKKDGDKWLVDSVDGSGVKYGTKSGAGTEEVAMEFMNKHVTSACR